MRDHLSSKLHILAVLAGFLVLLSSCSPDGVSNIMEQDDECWHWDEKVELAFDNQDTSMVHQLKFIAEFGPDYGYSNLHIRLHITSPSGIDTAYRFSFMLMDKEGNWYGVPGGGGAEFEFDLSQPVSFSEVGEYKFKVEPYMLDQQLCGVKWSGLVLADLE